jgi:glycosyltransferase involved in cell wall biosynthesis
VTDLLFVVGHPTQFEGPFFAYVCKTAGPDALQVLYSMPERVTTVHDPELSREVDWGFDLLVGYPSAVAPPGAGLRWAIRYLRKQRPRYVLVNGYHISLHRSVTLACRLLRIPVGLRIDGALFAHSRGNLRTKRLIYPLLSHVYHRIFSVGSVTDEYLASLGVPRASIARFTYAIDVDWFRMPEPKRTAIRDAVRGQYGVPADSTLIVSIAKFAARETPWDLIAALPKLPASEWTVLLVGDGPDRPRVEEMVAVRGRAARVILAGYVPYPDLPALYAAADIFVHPAMEEVWGVSVAEAMAAGLPVVASDRVGSARDLLVHGLNGGVYPLGKTDRLAEVLNEVRSMLSLGATFAGANDGILQSWNYKATWLHITEGITGQRNGGRGHGPLSNRPRDC